MKVAIVHDWLIGHRGGERVLEAICELFPDAPVYTLFHKPGSTSQGLESKEIHTTFLNRIPKIHDHYRSLLPLFPAAISSLQIPNDTELIISSSHCVAKGILRPAGAKHVCYIHSPMRYIYDQFDSYFGKEKFLKKLAGHLIRRPLQTWDFISNQQVDYFIANSHFVSQRVSLFYNRPSVVINPFVDLADFQMYKAKPALKEKFFLMVTAFAPNKRVDLAIEAFRELGWELRIVGGGQDEKALQELSVPNVKFLGNLSRAEVVDLMGKAQAFIFPGVEDFGITPLESLAAGTPVIAYRAGGVLETLNNKVAKFFDEPSAHSLIGALKSYDPSDFKREDLLTQAEKYSKEKFKSDLLHHLVSLL